MNHRERFAAVMNYEPYDRLPVYYFGLWDETLKRWLEEGLSSKEAVEKETGMDPDWEISLWNGRGMVRIDTISGKKDIIAEETTDHRIIRTSLGGLNRESRHGTAMPHCLEPELLPTRESWEKFKRFLNTNDPLRRIDDWEERAAGFEGRDYMISFVAGSLYGLPRCWMGVENISMLMYDDPVLFEEIIDYLCNFYMEQLKPVLEKVEYDLAYFFEDSCGKNGPLFSPQLYKKYYHKYYVKMIDFYHSMGVKNVLIDSDGKVDEMIPCWLESGFDIIFPVEVGTWKADPAELRKEFGKDLKMFGGFDKHLIPKGQAAIRKALEHLKPLVEEGGYIPIPDHRVPPNCSFEQFKIYVRVFKEVFNAQTFNLKRNSTDAVIADSSDTDFRHGKIVNAKP